MKRSHLATALRIQFVESGILTKRAACSLTDRDVIESYNLCGTCQKPIIPLENLWETVRRAPGLEEFIAYLQEQEGRAHPFEIECSPPLWEFLTASGIDPEAVAGDLAQEFYQRGDIIQAGYVHTGTGPLYYLYSRQEYHPKPIICLVTEEEYCEATGGKPAPPPVYH